MTLTKQDELIEKIADMGQTTSEAHRAEKTAIVRNYFRPEVMAEDFDGLLGENVALARLHYLAGGYSTETARAKAIDSVIAYRASRWARNHSELF